MRYQLDTKHQQEFNSNNIPVSFIKLSDIKKLTSVEKRYLKKEKKRGAIYYNLSLTQYLNIYKNGLHNKYRKQKKNQEDKKKILLIKKYI